MSSLLSFCGQDLATMVHDQGEIVDSIEQNIESTTVQVWTFFNSSSDFKRDTKYQWICIVHDHPLLGYKRDGTIESSSRLPKQGTANSIAVHFNVNVTHFVLCKFSLPVLIYVLFQARKKKIILAVLGLVILGKLLVFILCRSSAYNWLYLHIVIWLFPQPSLSGL